MSPVFSHRSSSVGDSVGPVAVLQDMPKPQNLSSGHVHGSEGIVDFSNIDTESYSTDLSSRTRMKKSTL